MQHFQPVNVSCRRVLIVEDEFAIADELASELAMLDATIVGYAASARKALEIINSGASPDLALVDLRLSDGSGEGLINELSSRGVEVILSTALASKDIPESLKEFRCLTKPYEVRAAFC